MVFSSSKPKRSSSTMDTEMVAIEPEHRLSNVSSENTTVVQRKAGVVRPAGGGSDDEEELESLVNKPTPSKGQTGDGAVPLAAQRLSLLRIIALAMFWWGFAAWCYVMLVLFAPIRATELSPDNGKGSILGLTLLTGAVISTVSSPIIGSISDRCWTRFGRRKPFMLVGVLCSAASGVLLHHAHNTVTFVLAFASAQFWMAVAAAPFNGLVADIVSAQQRGTVSGVIGFCVALGNLAGAGIGASYSSLGQATILQLTYGLVAVSTLITVCFTRELASSPLATPTVLPTSAPSAPRPRRTIRCCPNMLSPCIQHDFRWIFISRFLIQLGVFSVQEYLYFFVDSAVHLPDSVSPEHALAYVMLPLLCTACFAPLVAGCLSDSMGGRRKLMAAAGGLCMAGATLSLAWTRDWYKLPFIGGVFGCGFGVFNALDYALILDVCGNGEAAASELGLWNMSLSIPMCFAAPLAGLLLDFVAQNHSTHMAFVALFAVAASYFFVGTAALGRLRTVQ